MVVPGAPQMSYARVIYAEDFCIEWRREQDTIEVCMWGTAELATEPAAVMALDEARAVAEIETVRDIRLDLRAVEFMAAPCLKYLIAWFTELQDRPTTRYVVTMVWDPSNRWQRRTKDVLLSLTPQVLRAVEGQGPIRPRPTQD